MKVKVLEVQDGANLSYPHWTILKVENHPKEVMVYQNWEKCNGKIKVEDILEFEICKFPTYSNCEFDFVSGLKRAPKEAVIE